MTEVVTGEFAPPADPDDPSRSRIAVIRAIALLLVAVASVVLAVVFADHGVRVDTFPPYVGKTATQIKQFSGPWITGAFGLLALAGLLIVAAISDLRRPSAVAVAEQADVRPVLTEPPAFEPPAFEPPAFEPPAFEPPAFEPPAFEPPAFEPPAPAPAPGDLPPEPAHAGPPPLESALIEPTPLESPVPEPGAIPGAGPTPGAPPPAG